MQQNKGMPLDLAFVVARVVLVALAGWQGRMKYGTVQEKPLAIGQASIYRRLLDIWHLIEMKVKWLQTNLYPLPVARIVGGQLGVGGRFMFGRCFSSWEFLLRWIQSIIHAGIWDEDIGLYAIARLPELTLMKKLGRLYGNQHPYYETWNPYKGLASWFIWRYGSNW